MSVRWTFRCYVGSSGRDMIAVWYRRQPAAVQAAFDTLLEYLVQRERHEWVRPEFDQLGGRYRDLGELRFKVGNVQYRPLGFFGPARGEFTILAGASKKGSVYDPRDALETARKRRLEVLKDPDRSKICDH